MSLNPILQSLTFPDGTEFPGTMQQLSELLAQYYEITGLETFNGINDGDSTPASGDRDKIWRRQDSTGNDLGWYGWNGVAWVLVGPFYQEFTQTEINALTPIAGQSVWNTTESRIEVYSAGSWQPAVPTQLRYHYDANYFYPQHQLLASAGAPVTSWTTLDLTAYINALGLNAVNGDGDPKYTIKAAIIRATIAHGPSGFVVHTWDASVRVSSDDAYSTTATDILVARSLMTADDSQASASGQISGPVPLKPGTNEIFYVANGDWGNNMLVQVWLMGFTFTTTDAYFS